MRHLPSYILVLQCLVSCL